MKPSFHLTAMAVCLILCAYVASAQAAQGAAAPSATPQVNQFAVSVHDLAVLYQAACAIHSVGRARCGGIRQGPYPRRDLDAARRHSGRLRTIPEEEMIVAYCKTGPRSEQAASYLRAHGYQRVYVLTGGYTAWTAAQ